MILMVTSSVRSDIRLVDKKQKMFDKMCTPVMNDPK